MGCGGCPVVEKKVTIAHQTLWPAPNPLSRLGEGVGEEGVKLEPTTPHISRGIKDTERDETRSRTKRETEKERLREGVGDAINGVEGRPRATIDLEFGTTDRGGGVRDFAAELEKVGGTGCWEDTNDRGSQVDFDRLRLKSMGEGEFGRIGEVIRDTDLEAVASIRKRIGLDGEEGIALRGPERKILVLIERPVEDGKFELILIGILRLPLKGDRTTLVEAAGRHWRWRSSRGHL